MNDGMRICAEEKTHERSKRLLQMKFEQVERNTSEFACLREAKVNPT